MFEHHVILYKATLLHTDKLRMVYTVNFLELEDFIYVIYKMIE